LRYARDYAAKRRPATFVIPAPLNREPSGVQMIRREMNRLYVIESTPTITGANADHRFSTRPSGLRLVADLMRMGLPFGGFSALEVQPPVSPNKEELNHILRDVSEHKGASIVLAGDEQPPFVHGCAHALNAALGNVGNTVFYTDPIEANSIDQTQSLRELVGDIDAGKVDTLVIIGGNPAYNAPADFGLGERKLELNPLNKVKLRAHLSLYNNETSDICHWHIPATHYLESWGDTRSYDGTVTIVQPLIAPLYEGKTAHELLTLFSDNYDRKPYDIVRDYWRANPPVNKQSTEARGPIMVGAGNDNAGWLQAKQT